MHEMVTYIFGSLRTSEKAVKNIRKTLRRQARFNRSVVAFVWTTVGVVILMELNALAQDKRIEKLSIELEELKRAEGE